MPKSVSIVIPVFNERENTPLMHSELSTVLATCGRDYELIFVDDGSTDGTRECLKELTACDPHTKVIFFRRNYGQSAAMLAGLQHANCDYICLLYTSPSPRDRG